MGRWGRHKEAISEIGSNTLKLARLTKTNILIIKSPTTEINLPELPQTTEITEIEWDPSTAEIVERIPKFVRKMAKKSIEQKAQERRNNTNYSRIYPICNAQIWNGKKEIKTNTNLKCLHLD